MPAQESVRDRDFERFLTFVDAVAAIAITLLVLPLVDVASEVTSGSDVAEVLRAHADQFVAFGISFWVISRLWFVQHAVLKPVVAANRLLSVLLIFLLVLVLTQAVPALSYWPLVLLYAGGPVAARWRKWRGPLPG